MLMRGQVSKQERDGEGAGGGSLMILCLMLPLRS